jgi:serine/threonine-protein kinase RsbW
MSAVAPAPRSTGQECRCRPEEGPATEPGERELRVRQRADPAAIPVLRRRLRGWLAGSADLEEESAEAVVLAADEAVTNSVEHAYPRGTPGTVSVVATRSPCGHGVMVVIEDHGRWRPIPVDPGFRGRGLQLIHRLADRAGVTDSAYGTTVRMCWTP